MNYPITQSLATNSAPLVLSAYGVITKYGCSRNMINTMLQDVFNFPHQYLQALSVHRLHYWEGTKFNERLLNGTIFINTPSEKQNYHVIYDSCYPEECKQAKELKLSFRKAQEETGLTVAYVIVRTNIPSESRNIK